MMKLLILAPYPPNQAPSQRFRFEQYLPALQAAGIEVEYETFWTPASWKDMYKPGRYFTKVTGTLSGFFRRLSVLFRAGRYHRILIHREATPVGPPLVEWLLTKGWRKKIIFDFDDAIWLSNSSQANEKLVGSLKNHAKTAKIIAWSTSVFAGNEYLAAYARKFNSNVQVIPTTIDTEKVHNRLKVHAEKDAPVIGWTGTHSTLKQLEPLWPLLQELHQTHDFTFRVIADMPPALDQSLQAFVVFRPWSKATEIDDLLEFDIGVMPLFDTEWEKGKCGFKALQYMALGIPAVASAVGVNPEIVTDGEDGFLIPPKQPQLWLQRLKILLTDADLRSRMGAKARVKVEEKYSVAAYTERVVQSIRQPV